MIFMMLKSSSSSFERIIEKKYHSGKFSKQSSKTLNAILFSKPCYVITSIRKGILNINFILEKKLVDKKCIIGHDNLFKKYQVTALKKKYNSTNF